MNPTETLTTPAAEAAPANPGNSDEVLHIVGWLQDILGRVLRIKVPRSLCGASLLADLDTAGPGHGRSPHCAQCLAIHSDRGGGALVAVPPYNTALSVHRETGR